MKFDTFSHQPKAQQLVFTTQYQNQYKINTMLVYEPSKIQQSLKQNLNKIKQNTFYRP